MATSAIGLYPGFQEISLTPGEQHQGTISIVNPSEDPKNVVKYKIFPSTFFVEGEEYNNSFDIENDFTQLSNWITIEQPTGEIRGEEFVEVSYTVNVPANAAGGGQYASLIVQIEDGTAAEKDGNYTIGVSRRVASILYATVDGEIIQSGKVMNNRVDSLVLGGNLTANSLVENTGNSHFAAQYFLKVYTLFSDEEIYSNENEPKNNIILPGTKLAVTNTWDETPQIGVFRVEQTVSFLDNVSTTEKTVFVCPLWFLILWILLILGGVFWLFTNSRARKKATKQAKNYTGPKISR